MHLGHDVLVPDLAGWRRDRQPTLPDEPYFSLAPDWVCEVLSPATVALDRTRKLTVYPREQLPYAWLVDPTAFTIEVLHLDAGRWVILATCAGNDAVSLPPFDALPLDPTLLWEAPGTWRADTSMLIMTFTSDSQALNTPWYRARVRHQLEF